MDAMQQYEPEWISFHLTINLPFIVLRASKILLLI